jgi:C1A family cysteine protease
LHAVVVVGHGQHKGHDLFLVRNSWGGTWGLAGHGWVYEQYFMSRLRSLSVI